MKFHPFLGDSGALGPLFAKCDFLLEESGNARFMIFSQISVFGENQEFHENGAIAETPLIPKEYQRFWRMDCLQNSKYTKLAGIHGIL